MQPNLLDHPVVPEVTGDGMCQRLARFFLAHRGEWVDGLKLGQHAGSYAWRSRISDLRKAPYFMTVENRQYKRLGADGKKYVVSEYRYV